LNYREIILRLPDGDRTFTCKRTDRQRTPKDQSQPVPIRYFRLLGVPGRSKVRVQANGSAWASGPMAGRSPPTGTGGCRCDGRHPLGAGRRLVLVRRPRGRLLATSAGQPGKGRRLNRPGATPDGKHGHGDPISDQRCRVARRRRARTFPSGSRTRGTGRPVPSSALLGAPRGRAMTRRLHGRRT
jgi:hypothetical protein